MLKQFLIVEDTPSHLSDALKVGRDRGLTTFRNGMAENFMDFLKARDALLKSAVAGEIQKNEVAVLTDLYIPAWALKLREGEVLAPLGLLVMSECQKSDIPCVIVTAGYHHGPKYQQSCVVTRLMGWPEMVDSNTSDGPEDAPKKNWDEGFQYLVDELAKKTG